MDKLTSSTLRGNWATLLLPINKDESINFSLLEEQIDQLVAFGVDGIYSGGTAGELHNQMEQEFNKINELLSTKCLAAGMRFQIGCSHPAPIISLERIKRAVHLKPDAFQVILPDWVAPNEEEQLVFLQKMEEHANGIPLVLYNPPHAKLVLEPKDYQKFKEKVPSLIGIKVLSRDEQWVTEMKEFANHLSIFVPGHFLAKGVKAGIASGAYSNVACINPLAAQQQWHLMHQDIEEALRVESNMLSFFGTCIAPYQRKGFSNPALDKFLAAVGGWMNIPTRLRWPYRSISETDVLDARKIAMKMIPEYFNK